MAPNTTVSHSLLVILILKYALVNQIHKNFFSFKALFKHDTVVMAMANRILFLMGYVPLRSVKPTTAPIITGRRVNSDIITSRS